MPASYDDTRGPENDKGWKPAGRYKGADRELVNIWLTVYASPRSMGMSDAYEVPEAWRQNGKWFHVHNGKEMEIFNDYVTHYRPVRDVNASPPERLPLKSGDEHGS
jgi:hypothetical protein